MTTTTLLCPHCGQSIEMTSAIQHQMEAELSRAKEEQSAALRREYARQAEERQKQAVEAAVEEARLKAATQLEMERRDAAFRLERAQQATASEVERIQQQSALEKERLQQEAARSREAAEALRQEQMKLNEQLLAARQAQDDAERLAQKQLLERVQQIQAEAVQRASSEVERIQQQSALEKERLQQEAARSREAAEALRQEQMKLNEQLLAARQAQDDAERLAQKQLLERVQQIQAEAVQRASEDFHSKIREQEQTIQLLREQLTAAKQVAEQGSQQLQGEILELDMEQGLLSAFPADTIEEVRKGERGADIRQHVNERTYTGCGLILWECKNAKTYQAAWLAKLKEEMGEEKARFGVLVFQPAGGGGEDFRQLEENIFLVKPRYAVMVGTFLREVCVRVAIANRNAQGKDVKIEMMYDYLTGEEFSRRIRTIIDSYGEMARQLEQEKKQTQKRWAAQEKILQKATASLYGMSGDLQGIAGREIIALPDQDDAALLLDDPS